MVEKYKRGSSYSKRPAFADVAVDWQGLTLKQQSEVVINAEGLPELEGCPELLERAQALWKAVRHNLITGVTYNGLHDRDFAPQHTRLDSASAEAWIAITEQRLVRSTRAKVDLPPPSVFAEKLYKLDEVKALVGKSKSTLERWMAIGKFPRPIHAEPPRWSAASVDAYVESVATVLAAQVIARAAKGKLPLPPAAPGAECDDI